MPCIVCNQSAEAARRRRFADSERSNFSSGGKAYALNSCVCVYDFVATKTTWCIGYCNCGRLEREPGWGTRWWRNFASRDNNTFCSSKESKIASSRCTSCTRSHSKGLDIPVFLSEWTLVLKFDFLWTSIINRVLVMSNCWCPWWFLLLSSVIWQSPTVPMVCHWKELAKCMTDANRLFIRLATFYRHVRCTCIQPTYC